MLQTIATGSLAPGASATHAFTALKTRGRKGMVLNLKALHVRLAKGQASTVRPHACSLQIRDDSDLLFDGSGAELLMQARENSRAVRGVVGSASATDAANMTWRPGYGSDEADRQHAAGLFHGGSITVTAPADATGSQAFAYQIVAELAPSNELRIASRAVTRSIGASDRTIPGDFLLARLRDGTHTAGNSYQVETSDGSIVEAVTGAMLTDAYECAVGSRSDYGFATAALSGLGSPCIVRASEAYPGGDIPLTKLPHSAGNVALTSGFAGVPLVTYIYPRSKTEIESAAQRAAQRAGVNLESPKIKARFDGDFKASRFARFMPITCKVA